MYFYSDVSISKGSIFRSFSNNHTISSTPLLPSHVLRRSRRVYLCLSASYQCVKMDPIQDVKTREQFTNSDSTKQGANIEEGVILNASGHKQELSRYGEMLGEGNV